MKIIIQKMCMNNNYRKVQYNDHHILYLEFTQHLHGMSLVEIIWTDDQTRCKFWAPSSIFGSFSFAIMSLYNRDS